MELKRISMGSIDGLVENPDAFYGLGPTSFKTSRFIEYKLTVKTPDEARKIKTAYSLMRAPRAEFLAVVEKYLEENRLYLADANYRRKEFGVLFPHKLEGMLYKKIPQKEEKKV